MDVMPANNPPPPDWTRRLWLVFVRYIDRNGIQFDYSINTLTGGRLNCSVSLRVAELERAYELHQTRNPVGCWFCWFLNHMVQKGHCALMLDPNAPPSDALTFVRAGLAFGTVIVAILGMGFAAVHLVGWATVGLLVLGLMSLLLVLAVFASTSSYFLARRAVHRQN